MTKRRRPRRVGPWLRLCVVVLRPLMLALTRRSWVGGEHVPASGGAVLVANHISWFDPVAFAHFVYDNGRVPRFLAKSQLFSIPVVGRVIRGAGQIPVVRGSTDAAKAYAAAVEAVRRGECVIVYPEGTVTRDPGLWPMAGRTGAARIALLTGVPVVPVAQWGPHEVLAPYGKRLRLLPRKVMHMRAGPPVDLADLAGRDVNAEVLREATARILAAITALLAEIREEPAPPERFDPRTAGVPRPGDPRREPLGEAR